MGAEEETVVSVFNFVVCLFIYLQTLKSISVAVEATDSTALDPFLPLVLCGTTQEVLAFSLW